MSLIPLSSRARRELAVLHAAEAMHVLAAVQVPLHVLPLGGVMFCVLSLKLGWLGFFLAWSVAQIVMHFTLLRAADGLLDQTRRNFLIALTSGTLLLALAVAGQIIIVGLLGPAFFAIVLLTSGLFDLLAVAALIYTFWATHRALFGRFESPSERHIGFEVVLPHAHLAMREDERP